MAVTTTVEAKFRRPTRRKRREWQQAMREYRDVKQRLVNGWEAGEIGYSVTTGAIDSPLHSAIQNQAIREAKAQHREDGAMRYTSAQPFATNNQNWEIDRTENGSVLVGFPCISGWWYAPIDVHDDIEKPIGALLDDEAKKTRLRVYRRGSNWYCSFSVEYDATPYPVRGRSAWTSASVISSPPTRSGMRSRCSSRANRRSISGGGIVPYAIRCNKRVRCAHATAWVTKSTAGYAT